MSVRYLVFMIRPVDILSVLHRAAASDPVPDTQALAALSGWSPTHFHRRFRATTTLTPKTWLDRLAVARALTLLRETSLPIHQVASDAGFASHEVFTRTFQRVLGIPPSALREGTTDHLHHAACFALHHLALDPRTSPMAPTITLENRAAVPFLFQRRTVPGAEMQPALAAVLPAVFVHCQQSNVPLAGPPVTRYAAMSRGRFTIEAGFPVATAEPADGFEAGELMGGDLAVAVHVGPYDTLSETHAALETWVEAHGHTVAGAPWESYLTDPGDVPNPAEWQTEVCLPVTRKG